VEGICELKGRKAWCRNPLSGLPYYDTASYWKIRTREERGERDLNNCRENDAEEETTVAGAIGTKWKKTTKEASGKWRKRSG